MNEKEWKKLELDVAKDIGGWLSPGSGNKPINKSDVFVRRTLNRGGIFVEAKWTSKSYYNLKKELIEGVYRRANAQQSVPIIIVRFENDPKNYIAIIINRINQVTSDKKSAKIAITNSCNETEEQLTTMGIATTVCNRDGLKNSIHEYLGEMIE